MSDTCYGLGCWDRLEVDEEDVIHRIIEDACEKVGEEFDAIAARIEWPIKIVVFRRCDIGGEECAKRIARDAIDHALEYLDEEYSDPDGDPTEATEGMKKAALLFGRAVVADYVPWSCVPTGEVIEYTQEEAKRLVE